MAAFLSNRTVTNQIEMVEEQYSFTVKNGFYDEKAPACTRRCRSAEPSRRREDDEGTPFKKLFAEFKVGDGECSEVSTQAFSGDEASDSDCDDGATSETTCSVGEVDSCSTVEARRSWADDSELSEVVGQPVVQQCSHASRDIVSKSSLATTSFSLVMKELNSTALANFTVHSADDVEHKKHGDCLQKATEVVPVINFPAGLDEQVTGLTIEVLAPGYRLPIVQTFGTSEIKRGRCQFQQKIRFQRLFAAAKTSSTVAFQLTITPRFLL